MSRPGMPVNLNYDIFMIESCDRMFLVQPVWIDPCFLISRPPSESQAIQHGNCNLSHPDHLKITLVVAIKKKLLRKVFVHMDRNQVLPLSSSN